MNEAAMLLRRIRDNNRRYAPAILRRGFQTLVAPSLVLIVFAVMSSFIIGWVDVVKGSRPLTIIASAGTFVVTIMLARIAFQWSERRYGGWTLLRAVGQINSEVRRLERDIAGGSDEVNRITASAHEVWNAYIEALQNAGFTIL